MRNDDNTCSKKYPKEFRETTLPNIGRYAQYRRRNNGRSGKVKRGQRIYEDMTNQDVVPYNPWLLKKYNCHLNVELVNTTRACKYIFKYISKGSDSAILKVVHSTRNTTETANTIEAENTNKKYDEITEHIESRYLSSCEAAWRIFELPLIDKMQKIEKLPIHLEGERSVVFREGDEQVAIENAEGKFSKLEAYFILNREDEHANNIKYPDIPMYYSWNASAHKWVRRFYDKGIIISRMYTVSPKEVERMHLRILLLHVAGATSFSDLKTVDGVLYATFQESARNRQLTENDDAWIACIEECSNSKMPAQLRRLFAYLLCYCSIENALELWRKFKKHFIEDYVRRGKSEEIAEVKALRRVDNILRYLGTSLSVYGISIPETNDPINDDDDSDNDGGAQHDGNSVVAPVEEIVDRMNVEQRSYYEQVINAVLNDANRDRRFFIYGSAGCGKTYLYNTIIDLLARRNISAIVVAFTGIAALLLRGGQTAHSKFKLPIDLTAESTSTIMAQSEEAQMLRDAKLLIFDEISMARYEIINIIDRCLRDIRQDERPFGNIVTILGGDIKQLLPIVSGGRAEQLKSLFYHCNAWHSFKHMKLNVNMRADPAELEFANWLENVGRHSPEIRVTHPRSMRNDLVQIPNECVVEDVVGAIYGDIDFKFPTFPQLLADRSIICLRNDVCTEINNKMLRRLPGDIVTVYSVDNVDSDNPEDAENFSMEFLNRIKYGGLPDHELMLKVGAPVILLRNIDARSGLVNGTRLIIKQVSQNAIIADIAFGVNKGKTVFIPKFDIKCRVDTHSVNLKRRQFPVKLSFAITVNKAQGQTLEKVGICLTTPVYAHGQLYTALSRTKRMSALKVQIRTSEHQGTAKENHINRTLARNVVYESVMDRFQ
uniref:ATP-dependent DNA helicase n=1 Tax=Diabrotica virgifera virgifera TaxID=50390 RepID=A0A6P7G5R2_DIAVI